MVHISQNVLSYYNVAETPYPNGAAMRWKALTSEKLQEKSSWEFESAECCFAMQRKQVVHSCLTVQVVTK